MLESYNGLHNQSIQLEIFLPLYFSHEKETKRMESKMSHFLTGLELKVTLLRYFQIVQNIEAMMT